MRFRTLAILAVLAGISISGCASTESPTTTAAAPATPTAEVRAPTTRPGDGAAHGQVLFNTMQPAAGFACATCHYPHSEARLIGPGLLNIRERAMEYSPDDTIEAYLLNSILHPDQFIVPAVPPYQRTLMPQTYGDIFSEQELQDLIAFLLSL